MKGKGWCCDWVACARSKSEFENFSRFFRISFCQVFWITWCAARCAASLGKRIEIDQHHPATVAKHPHWHPSVIMLCASTSFFHLIHPSFPIDSTSPNSPHYAVSGNTPEDPVVSAKSGHVYERRLVEKYIEANGKCPVTGEPLTTSDLIAIKSM